MKLPNFLGRKKEVVYPETVPGRSDSKVVYYNDAKNTVTTIDPLKRMIVEQYDWNGNLVELTARGDSSTSSQDFQSYFYEYDELNRKTSFTDPEGIITTYTYDERNLLVRQDYGVTGADCMTMNRLVRTEDRG
ncbi:MAG: RHS repeat protein [Spirochaetales bacterium]|nr:RHS repeat protein [Spirochaetales bacterium]